MCLARAGSIKGGKWVWQDGTSWHGGFKDNKPLGKGVFYFPSGNAQEGEYVEERNAEDEEAPPKLTWRGGPVTVSAVPASSMIAAPVVATK